MVMSGVCFETVAANVSRGNAKQGTNDAELYMSAWSEEAGGRKYVVRSY